MHFIKQGVLPENFENWLHSDGSDIYWREISGDLIISNPTRWRNLMRFLLNICQCCPYCNNVGAYLQTPLDGIAIIIM